MVVILIFLIITPFTSITVITLVIINISQPHNSEVSVWFRCDLDTDRKAISSNDVEVYTCNAVVRCARDARVPWHPRHLTLMII